MCFRHLCVHVDRPSLPTTFTSQCSMSFYETFMNADPPLQLIFDVHSGANVVLLRVWWEDTEHNGKTKKTVREHSIETQRA